LFLPGLSFGQVPFTIKGKVTDKQNEPMVGAGVVIAGTSLGSSVDIDGNYQFSGTLPEGNYTVTVNFVGYLSAKNPVSLRADNAQLTVDFVLSEDILSLDEVVVTGSTLTSAKRELGNTINTVKATDLQQSGSPNLINSLQGKVPGAQITQNSGDPAGGISIRLRGIKSLAGPSDPLYVVDGVIVSNASTNVSQIALANDAGNANLGQNRLSDINPADIESLTVLNGAAAAAQYGSRAANGVVIITTKRGQTGAPQVTFSTSFNINELRKSVPVNTYGKQFGFAGLRLYPIASATPSQSITTIGIVRDGATTQLATNLVDVQRYNYFDQIFRTAYGTENVLSVSGGREKTQYYVSAGYLKNGGIIKDTDFTRYSFRARVDQGLTTWAKLSASLSYSNSFSNEKANGNVFYSPINAVNITNNIYDITQRDIAGDLKAVEPGRVNPLSTIEDMKFSQSVNRSINSLQLNLAPFKGFTIDYIVGVDAYSQVGKNYIRPYPYQAEANLPPARYPFGFAATANNQVVQFNNDLNVTYERTFGELFKLNAAAGYSYQYFQSDYTISNGQNQAPSIETVNGSSSTTIQGRYGLDRFGLSGVFAQATIGYRNLAFLTGAVRRDQSTKFSPTQTNQYYPKVSGSFILSDLGFWNQSALGKVVNSFKLRASYGDAGNLSGIGSYDRFYQFSPVPFLGKSTFVPGATLANPEVRPERMRELEGGVDVAFLNSRLGLGITLYAQEISDLVLNRTIAPTSGGVSIITNVGKMENKGLEIALNAVPIKTKDFTWDLTLIFSRNRNKVISMSQPVLGIDLSSASGTPAYLIEGQPVGVFFGTGYARNPDGSLLLTAQGFPQSERASSQQPGSVAFVPARKDDGTFDVSKPLANVIIGDPNPDWTGSLNTNFSYKRLNLHVLLDVVQGVDVFNADKRTRQGVGLGDYAERELRGELPRGYIFAIYNTQEFRIDDGSYTKLREVALSYTFPNLIKGLSSLNVALIGRNLYSWDNYNGFDPETNAGGNNDLLRGIDFGNVPIPRTYQVKLTASF
jgi:TonB-linked SusC/RagA family outer membrane protein